MEQKSKVVERTLSTVKDSYYYAMDRLGSENDITPQPLSIDYLNYLHEDSVTYFGGSLEVRDENLLKSVSVAPFQVVFGQELYPTIFEKAAKYMLDFSRYQVYVDGNKRMGISAAAALLIDNGLKLTLSEEKAYALVMDVATGKIDSVEEIANLIKENFTFLKDDEKVEENNEIDEHDL